MIRKNNLFLILLLLLTGCNSGNKPNDGLGYFNVTMTSGSDNVGWFSNSGPQVIWEINLINCSDYAAKQVKFYQNSSKYPFIEIDSISPHAVKDVWRTQFKPKIIISKDTLRWEYTVKGKKKKSEWILSDHKSVSGDYNTFEELKE